MVKYITIIKIIEDNLNKCTVTLKNIKQQISPLIKKITDTQEEYELLMDKIPRFYRDYWNAPLEHQLIKAYEKDGGKEWENVGTETEIQISEEITTHGEFYGLLLAIHNHPFNCCFQSPQDFITKSELNEKYSVTVAKDGIMIAKKTGYNPTSIIEPICYNLHKEKVEKIKQTPQYKDTIKKYEDNKLTKEECDVMVTKVVNDWYSEHLMECKNDLDEQFQKEDCGIQTDYMYIKRNG